MRLQEFKKLIREEVRRVLKEAKTLKSGTVIDDWDLVDKNIIKPADHMYWSELFTDEPVYNPKKFVKMANTWLKDNGYTWRVSSALNQDADGQITWKIQ